MRAFVFGLSCKQVKCQHRTGIRSLILKKRSRLFCRPFIFMSLCSLCSVLDYSLKAYTYLYLLKCIRMFSFLLLHLLNLCYNWNTLPMNGIVCFEKHHLQPYLSTENVPLYFKILHISVYWFSFWWATLWITNICSQSLLSFLFQDFNMSLSCISITKIERLSS